MTFTNCLLIVVVAAVAALIVLARGLYRASYSRRMAKRAERFGPVTYTESRGRGCAL